MEEITIIVADDHALFRQGVINTLSLEPTFKVIGQAENGNNALKQIRSLHPCVAIIDINMPGINGQQVTHRVAQEKIPTRVMLLTAYNDREQIIHAAWAGAAAYCAKDVDPQWFIQAVKEVAGGKFVEPGNTASVRVLAKCGFTDLQLAKWFEVNVDTIYQWKLKYPEFAEALRPHADVG